jgi:hypothetical protein
MKEITHRSYKDGTGGRGKHKKSACNFLSFMFTRPLETSNEANSKDRSRRNKTPKKLVNTG